MFGLTGVIVGGASVVALGGLLATGYVKSTNRQSLYIISGLRKEPRIVIGKAIIKMEVIMKIKDQKIDLKNMKESCDLVKEIMEKMNEKELIFFANDIRSYIDLRLLEK